MDQVPIQIRQRADQPRVHQLGHGFLSKPVDVQRGLRREVFDGPLELRRTDRLSGAVIVGALARDRRLADRAAVGHAERFTAPFAGNGDALRDGGDHVAGPFDFDRVTDADVFSRHFIGIVERGAADRDAADFDRCEQRHRRQGARPPDGHDDILHDRDFLARRELVRDGPTGAPGFEPELLLPIPTVDFDDDAVDLVGETVAHRFSLVMVGDHVLDRGTAAPVQGNGKSPSGQGVEFIPVGRQPGPGESHHFVTGDDQRTSRRDRGIQLPQRSRGGIARVRKGLLPSFRDPAVERLKIVQPHVDFTPDDQAVRIFRFRKQLEGEGADRSQIDRDILARRAVASGRPSGKQPAFVEQLHG